MDLFERIVVKGIAPGDSGQDIMTRPSSQTNDVLLQSDIGTQSSANTLRGVSVTQQGVAVGIEAVASGTNATAVGESAVAGGVNATVVGQRASVISGANNTVVGQNASVASGLTNSTVVGQGVAVTGGSSVAVGQGIILTGAQTTIVGYLARSSGQNDVCIGFDVSAGSGGTNVAVGKGATTAAGNTASNTVVGALAVATGGNAITVGTLSSTTAADAVAVGSSCAVSGQRSTGIGQGITITHSDTVIIGKGGVSTANGQVIIGTTTTVISDIWFGRSTTHTGAAQATNVHATDGTGSNVAGDNLVFYSGRSTGNVAGGNIDFMVAPASGAGSGLNAAALCLRVPPNGGTASFALITDGSGVGSWVTGQSIAGLTTAATPQFARLGVGAAANASIPISARSTSVSQIMAYGWETVSGAVDTSGEIVLGNTAANQGRLHYDGAAGNHLYLDNSYDNNAGTIRFRVRIAGTPLTQLNISGLSATFGIPLILKNYTVATLPTGTQGMLAYCTDLLAPTFLTNAVGGGAIVGPVFYDGANWKTV